MVRGQAVKGEGVQVDVFAGSGGPAGIRHLGEVAAVLPVAELALEEIEAGLGRGESSLLLDPGRREGTKEPELSGLECQELLPRRGKAASLERLEIAAVLPIHAGGKIKIDDTRLEDLPAAARLILQVGPRGRGSRRCVTVAGRRGRQQGEQKEAGRAGRERVIAH